MSTLAEIEAAADGLPPEQKQELLLFLAARLRAQGAELPDPRDFSREQIATWTAEDEVDMAGSARASETFPALTLDRGDFGELMGTTFYGLVILRPGTSLERERSRGRPRNQSKPASFIKTHRRDAENAEKSRGDVG